MRSPGTLAMALIVLRLSVVLADDDDDFDLDLDEEYEDGSSQQMKGGAGAMSGRPPHVEDFDLEMPENERTTRMGTCFSYTIWRMQASSEMMHETARQIMEQHGIGEQEAVTAVLSNWMMACYMNIESEEIDEAQATGTKHGSPIEVPADKEEELFDMNPSAKQTVTQASDRQWALIQTILKENSQNVPTTAQQQQQYQEQHQRQQQQEQRQQNQDTQTPRGQPQLPGTSMDAGTGFLYMLAVFAVLFGVGTLVVLKLLKQEGNGKVEKDRGAKSEKKREKAEKQAAKKRM